MVFKTGQAPFGLDWAEGEDEARRIAGFSIPSPSFNLNTSAFYMLDVGIDLGIDFILQEGSECLNLLKLMSLEQRS